MVWACCKNRKGSEEVTGTETRRREEEGRPKLKWLDDVELDLSIRA
jgi:hypothetical protein